MKGGRKRHEGIFFTLGGTRVARGAHIMEARGTPGSRAVAIANRHAATAVRAGSGGASMTEASCMTLAYAKSRVEASRTGGEHATVRRLKGRQLLHGRRYMAACTSRPTHGATYRATAAVYLLPTLHDRRARRLAPHGRERQLLHGQRRHCRWLVRRLASASS